MRLFIFWPGLPNYRALFHFEQNLPADYQFLKELVKGARQLIILQVLAWRMQKRRTNSMEVRQGL